MGGQRAVGERRAAAVAQDSSTRPCRSGPAASWVKKSAFVLWFSHEAQNR